MCGIPLSCQRGRTVSSSHVLLERGPTPSASTASRPFWSFSHSLRARFLLTRALSAQRRDTAIKLLGKESLYYQARELFCVVSGGTGFRTLSWFVNVRPVALPLTEQLENSQRRCAYAPGLFDGALRAPHT